MKRTFIPPDYRPEIRGAKLAKRQENHYINIFSHKKKRREFILRLLKEEAAIPNTDTDEVRRVISELFPTLQ